MIKHTLIAIGAALALVQPAHAQNETAPAAQEDVAATQTLLPESVNLSVVEGSTVPADCQYPATISDTTSFELACVTMPRFSSGLISAEYIAQLGQLGWRQGAYIEGGMTAIRTDDRNCERVLNIFPFEYPPGAGHSSSDVVLWFVLERAPRCSS